MVFPPMKPFIIQIFSTTLVIELEEGARKKVRELEALLAAQKLFNREAAFPLVNQAARDEVAAPFAKKVEAPQPLWQPACRDVARQSKAEASIKRLMSQHCPVSEKALPPTTPEVAQRRGERFDAADRRRQAAGRHFDQTRVQMQVLRRKSAAKAIQRLVRKAKPKTTTEDFDEILAEFRAQERPEELEEDTRSVISVDVGDNDAEIPPLGGGELATTIGEDNVAFAVQAEVFPEGAGLAQTPSTEFQGARRKAAMVICSWHNRKRKEDDCIQEEDGCWACRPEKTCHLPSIHAELQRKQKGGYK